MGKPSKWQRALVWFRGLEVVEFISQLPSFTKAVVTFVMTAAGAVISWVLEGRFGTHLLVGAIGGFGVLLVMVAITSLLPARFKSKLLRSPATTQQVLAPGPTPPSLAWSLHVVDKDVFVVVTNSGPKMVLSATCESIDGTTDIVALPFAIPWHEHSDEERVLRDGETRLLDLVRVEPEGNAGEYPVVSVGPRARTEVVERARKWKPARFRFKGRQNEYVVYLDLGDLGPISRVTKKERYERRLRVRVRVRSEDGRVNDSRTVVLGIREVGKHPNTSSTTWGAGDLPFAELEPIPAPTSTDGMSEIVAGMQRHMDNLKAAYRSSRTVLLALQAKINRDSKNLACGNLLGQLVTDAIDDPHKEAYRRLRKALDEATDPRGLLTEYYDNYRRVGVWIQNIARTWFSTSPPDQQQTEWLTDDEAFHDSLGELVTTDGWDAVGQEIDDLDIEYKYNPHGPWLKR